MVKMMPEESPLLKIAGSGVLGKRVEYPLQSINGLETYSDTVHLMPALAARPSPVLVGIRNSPSGAEDYTLVVIDRDDVLTSLMISDTLTITPSTSGATRRVVSETLKSGYVERASLVLWFETEEGVRRPFIVTKLDFVPDYQHFVQYYTGPGGPETGCRDECIDFALFPASDGRYRMVIRLSGALNGPVQAGDVTRCRSWVGKAGLWHWFLRVVNRCARW